MIYFLFSLISILLSAFKNYSDLSVELPFTLTHPKPEPLLDNESKVETKITGNKTDDNSDNNNGTSDQTAPVDHNLIEFDTRYVFYS